MSQHSCPTVAIQMEPSEGNPTGVVIVNESDFDEATMTKADVSAEVVPVEVVPVDVVPVDPVDPVVTTAAVPVAKVVAPWKTK
jgi:hypothetical protein